LNKVTVVDNLTLGEEGRGGDLCVRKNHTLLECVSAEIAIQTQSNCSVETSTIPTPNETVLIPKIVKPRILYDLD